MNVDLKAREADASDADEVLEERKALMADIKRRLSVRSVEDAATKLGMTKSQLDAITRPDRSIPARVAAQLVQAMPGLRIPGGVAHTGAEEASIGGWHDRLQTEVFRAVRTNPITSDFDRQVRRLFQQLGRGDYYLLFSFDQKPYEMESPRFFDQVVTPALMRGAKFVYVVPSSEDLPVPARTLNVSPAELENKINQNKRALPDNCRDNLEVYTIKDCPLLIPGIKFAFVLSRSLQDTARSNCVASISVPIGDKDSIHIPLADSFAEFASAYLKLRKDDKKRPLLFEAYEKTAPENAPV